MTSELVVWVGLALMAVLAVSVVGTVKGRERLAFVPGVLLVMLSMTVLSGTLAGVVAVVGLAAVLASTVPLLRE